jgi:F-type H+-transporting ATPase subunit epsilon
MAEKTSFDLVSPERVLLSQEVEMVVVPGGDGNFGVLKGHAPLLSTVRPGVIDVYETRPTRSQRIFVAGGFAEVNADRCVILAEGAIALDEIDRPGLDQQIKDLEEDLADAKTAEEKVRVTDLLVVARAKLDAVSRA